MAKIKVYELAKELGVENKEVLSELEKKGIEKGYRNALEDELAEEIRVIFKAKTASPKTEKNAETKATEAKAAETKSAEIKAAETKTADSKQKAAKPEEPKQEKAAEAKPAKAKENGGAPVKKKKSIIFISNPQNSKMPGAQIPKKPIGVEKKKAAKPADTAAAKAAADSNSSAAKSSAAIKPAAEKTETPLKEKEIKTAETLADKTSSETAAAANTNIPKNENETAAVQKNTNIQKRDNQRNDNQRNDSPRNDGQRRDDQRGDRQRGDGQRRDGQRRDDQRGDRQRGDGQRRDGQRRDDQRGDRQRGDRNKSQGYGGRDNERGRDSRGGFGGGKGSKGGFVPESPIKDAEKHRDEEKRRISQEKDKRNRKDLIYEDDGDMMNIKGKNKPGKFIKPEKKPAETVEEQIKVITLPEKLTIKELADKMKLQPSAIVKKLFMQGQIVTVNQEISYETAENIAIEYDVICEKEVKVDVIEELLKENEENEADMVSRPPVICVMGHVDHGKTSLLDAIRKTNVTDKEAGGITQHIGAYTVKINDQKITFLDTPGHEAFTAMRMRGANSTDIAILVVAADDGVMPQTVEAINHAKAAGIEIIVAVNKIDKPGANVERVKQELTEYGLIAEDWGGSTVFVPVSAKSGEGIEQLLEMILLTAEVLELKANPNRRARGLVIEAELDKGRGPVATVLVQKGTLKVGDFVSAGAASGKVRAMIDDKGRRVKEAGPSTPVEILGLGDVPNAGDIFIAHENDKEAKYYAETFVAQNKEKLLEDTKTKMSLDDLFSQIQAGSLKELNLIIKADVQGSVEAVKQSLMKLSNDEVVVKCIHGGVGAINESDVILASASNAIIIGFNVRPDAVAKNTAEREGVDVRLYKVIYQAIEDIEAAMKGMLDPIFEEKVIGHAEVRQIFKASAVGNIAGSYVLDGVFQRDCKIRITREGEQIYEGRLASLKRFKDDVKEVKAGFECGLVFEGFDSMQELDIVEAYIMVEVPR